MVEKPKKKKQKEKPEPEVFTVRRPSMPDPLLAFEEKKRQEEEEEKKRLKDRMENKIREQEAKVDRLRMDIRKRCKSMVIPKAPKYKPLEPVKKSSKLAEYEDSIQKGTFFDESRSILENVRQASRRYKLLEKLEAHGAVSGAGVPMFGRV